MFLLSTGKTSENQNVIVLRITSVRNLDSAFLHFFFPLFRSFIGDLVSRLLVAQHEMQMSLAMNVKTAQVNEIAWSITATSTNHNSERETLDVSRVFIFKFNVKFYLLSDDDKTFEIQFHRG